MKQDAYISTDVYDEDYDNSYSNPIYVAGFLIMNVEPVDLPTPTQIPVRNCYQNVHGQMMCWSDDFDTNVPVYNCFNDVHNRFICSTDT